jgi:transposase
MDVHKDTMAVASVAKAHDAEVVFLGTIGTRHGDSDQRIRTMPSQAQHLICVYEAGPCGSWLYRDLTKTGDDGWVVAPAVIPNKPDDRVNTDRRDAVPWARLARSGDLTVVDVPQVADEALRALARGRDDTRGDLKSAKVRLNAFVRRHALRSTGRATWGPAHRRWLSAVVCPTPAPPSVFQAYGRAMHDHPARLQRFDQALHDQVLSWRLPPVGEALQALRGVPCIAAMTMGAAMGDLTRFERSRALMKCLGLRPAAYTSAERRRQGAMTTAGHTHARSALVDGAWASRSPAEVSRHVPRRREQPPQISQDMRWRAQGRRCQRDRHLIARGTHAHVVTVAMARALAGFMWAIATQVPVTP